MAISAAVPVLSRNSLLWPVLGALAGCAIAVTIAYSAAGADINKMGDWRNGAARFVGMIGVIGLFAGWIVTARLTRGRHVARHGMTLSYRPIEPTATGYRELSTLTIEDLFAKLRAFGYQPTAKECDDLGTVRGPVPATTPLAGANFAITDQKVKGWVRVQLADPPEGSERALGLIEAWTARGESAGELALFALRSLDDMLGDLTASYDDSALSGDPAKLFVAALPDRPKHR